MKSLLLCCMVPRSLPRPAPAAASGAAACAR